MLLNVILPFLMLSRIIIVWVKVVRVGVGGTLSVDDSVSLAFPEHCRAGGIKTYVKNSSPYCLHLLSETCREDNKVIGGCKDPF